MFFNKKYCFLGVRFTPDGRIYNYISDDRTVRSGDKVRVPADGEIKDAMVCSVGIYDAKNAPYPVRLTKKILGRSNTAQDIAANAGKAVDISVKKISAGGGYALVVTDAGYRREQRRRFCGMPGVSIVETYPVSRAGEAVKYTGSRKKTETAKWYLEEHLFGGDVYRCSRCGGRYKKYEAFCPGCHAQMIKTKTDPQWIDEIETFESFDD